MTTSALGVVTLESPPKPDQFCVFDHNDKTRIIMISELWGKQENHFFFQKQEIIRFIFYDSNDFVKTRESLQERG